MKSEFFAENLFFIPFPPVLLLHVRNPVKTICIYNTINFHWGGDSMAKRLPGKAGEKSKKRDENCLDRISERMYDFSFAQHSMWGISSVGRAQGWQS